MHVSQCAGFTLRKVSCRQGPIRTTHRCSLQPSHAFSRPAQCLNSRCVRLCQACHINVTLAVKAPYDEPCWLSQHPITLRDRDRRIATPWNSMLVSSTMPLAIHAQLTSTRARAIMSMWSTSSSGIVATSPMQSAKQKRNNPSAYPISAPTKKACGSCAPACGNKEARRYVSPACYQGLHAEAQRSVKRFMLSGRPCRTPLSKGIAVAATPARQGLVAIPIISLRMTTTRCFDMMLANSITPPPI